MTPLIGKKSEKSIVYSGVSQVIEFLFWGG